ncbi:transmembrane protein, putative [Medicago truncatula]|uniref:Transmembrane protein, putative n=1 Tax=Medicago truncatula TaxID=3880 RepID=A0A072TYZ1_MEDTR|nr:transmembrane protein, putative [Medicago truncatula]
MDVYVSRGRPHLRRSLPTQVVFNYIVLSNVQIARKKEDNNLDLLSRTKENNSDLHNLVAFSFYVLLGFLQLRNPQSPAPFQIHPKTSFLSIASYLAYYLTLWVGLKFSIPFRTKNTLMEVFGSLSLISLVLMLLPDHSNWGESLKYIAYTLLFLIHVVAFIIRVVRTRKVAPPLLPY